jgi:hypothetical protein
MSILKNSPTGSGLWSRGNDLHHHDAVPASASLSCAFGCIAVALSHLHGSEEVVVAVIGRRLTVLGAAQPPQDQIAVIEAAAIT